MSIRCEDIKDTHTCAVLSIWLRSKVNSVSKSLEINLELFSIIANNYENY